MGLSDKSTGVHPWGMAILLRKTARFLLFLLLVAMALGFLLPLYAAVANSFRILKGSVQVQFIPLHPTLDNYKRLFLRTGMLRWLFNSLFVSGSTTVLHLFLSATAGYVFAKKRFPGDRVLFWILMSTLMMPIQVILVPLFVQIRTMHLFDTYAGLILPMIGGAFGMFLMRQFMLTIPSELLDAARIDGCSELGVFWRVVLPLSKPALGALTIIKFIESWTNFMWQLVITNSEALITVPVGITMLASNPKMSDWGMTLAGATVSAIPMVLVFLLFQDYFVKGITMGAVKG